MKRLTVLLVIPLLLLVLPIASWAQTTTAASVGFRNGNLVAIGVTWGADVDMTLPSADGTSGQALVTDGSGAVSWGTTFGSFDTVAATGLISDSIKTKTDTTRFKADSTRKNVAIDSINLNVSDNSGLNLDLDHYYQRNVVQFMAASRDPATAYTGWTNLSAGVHTDNTTAGQFRTDAQSITITIPNGGQGDGATLDIADYDMTAFADGDTSTTADYALVAIYILTQDITDLGSSELQLIFGFDAPQTLTNYYSYNIAPGALTNGWNYVKIAKSAFTSNGSPNWNSIKFVCMKNNNTVTGAEVVFSFDYIAMVRDDPEGARPNPFQRESGAAVWTNDWDMAGAGNVWIADERGTVGALFPDNASVFTSYLTSNTTWGDYEVSGRMRVNSAGAAWIWFWANSGSTNFSQFTGGNNMQSVDSAGTQVNVSTTVAAANTYFYWRAIRSGAYLTASTSISGMDGYWTTTSSPGAQGLKTIRLAGIGSQRIFSFGRSTVQFAGRAGIADRLSKLFVRNDSLFWDNGDSLYAITKTAVIK